MNDHDSQVLPYGRGPRRLRFWKPAVAILVLMTGLIVTYTITQPSLRRQRLVSAGRDADQVRLLMITPAVRTMGEGTAMIPGISVEIRSADAVAELLDLLSFARSFPAAQCRCWGNMRIEFIRGEAVLASLVYLHDDTLRSADRHWLGDAQLTDASRDAFDEWLDRHGGTALDEAQMKAHGRWDMLGRQPRAEADDDSDDQE